MDFSDISKDQAGFEFSKAFAKRYSVFIPFTLDLYFFSEDRAMMGFKVNLLPPNESKERLENPGESLLSSTFKNLESDNCKGIFGIALYTMDMLAKDNNETDEPAKAKD